MQKIDFTQALVEILKSDKRYEPEAYQFVREGLDFTLKTFKKGAKGASRHVSGQQLLEGLRRYAIRQFGPMAKTVLEYWGVRRCEDFGEIVFNMVDKGILGKTEQDSRDDFKGGYDFEEAFVKPYQPARRSPPPRVDTTQSGSDRVRGGAPRSPHAKELSGGSN